ncbi:MAG: Hsp33 family molecular chaperone HslO [Alphaproteobacteria bacterium]|nr:Hsp33 family molecular chaperone HslO [Alphaproteobacteria bacterium]
MTTSLMVDISVPFLLPALYLRGQIVRLQNVTTTIINQHAYPYSIAKVLADLLVAGSALSNLLKYKGVFTLQIKTTGPMRLAVVDVTSAGHIRGYTQFKSQEVEKEAAFKDLLGEGYLVFTVDQGREVDRYQAIVSLNHDTLSEALVHYFQQSEQLETRICIASHRTKEGNWKSSALLLQQMPSQTIEAETWHYVEALLNTLSSEELLDFSVPYETLLYRLFHETDITVFDPIGYKAQCRCSEERIKTFLNTLSLEEVEGLLENGRLKISCEFCNHVYDFERKDIITIH